MERIKIVQKGWEGYTGFIAHVEFKDGVSVDKLTEIDVNRISANILCVSVDDEGNEGEQSGNAAWLVKNTLTPAEVNKPLDFATEEDLKPNTKSKLERGIRPTDITYGANDLEDIADRDGIKGLRKIGDLWEVKGRSIPEMITAILGAQERFDADFARKNENRLVQNAPVEVPKGNELNTDVTLLNVNGEKTSIVPKEGEEITVETFNGADLRNILIESDTDVEEKEISE